MCKQDSICILEKFSWEHKSCRFYNEYDMMVNCNLYLSYVSKDIANNRLFPVVHCHTTEVATTLAIT